LPLSIGSTHYLETKMGTTYQEQYDSLLAELNVERLLTTDQQIEDHLTANGMTFDDPVYINRDYTTDQIKQIYIQQFKSERAAKEDQLTLIADLIGA